MAFDFVGERMGVKHNSAQNFLREEFQGHHTNQAYYKSGTMSPEYLSKAVEAAESTVDLILHKYHSM
jgi:hypothetical protein